MNARIIPQATRPPRTQIAAVPSKSDSHRGLITAALARGESSVEGPLEADDIERTLDGLAALGVRWTRDGGVVHVQGTDGAIPGGGRLDLAESGTSARLLTAVAALGGQPSRLDGAPRLRERPLAALVEALGQLGAHVQPAGTGGFPLVAGGQPLTGDAATVDASVSSQFASALTLIGPALPCGLDLRLRGPVVSRPYLTMTVDTLQRFGGQVDQPSEDRLQVAAGGLTGRHYRVEGDYSTASYPLAAAALLGGQVRVDGLRRDSRQADRLLLDLLSRLGVEVEQTADSVTVRGGASWGGFEIDLTEAPDLAPTVAILALAATGPSVLRGVAHLRVKESDRLAVLARNLSALGRPSVDLDDRLEVGGDVTGVAGAPIETASDHRMAMAFAIAGLRFPGVVVDDPACVSKSNPGFWRQLEQLLRG